MRFEINPWNCSVLSKFATKISEKNKGTIIRNVISNSATLGLISQIDYFDKAIANNENIDKYYIIRQGNFVYNPRKSNTAPYGPVNIYEYEQDGVVSPLYLCFKINNIDKKYLYYYFKSNCWHRYMYLNGDSGARSDRVSVKDEVFFNIPISYPTREIQQKISSFLSLIDQRIDTQNKIIKEYHTYKNAIIDELIFKNPDFKIKVPLREFAVLKNGYAFKSDTYDDNGQYNIITIANVSGEKYINVSLTNKIISLPKDIQDHQILQHGDILISLTGNVGRVSIVDVDNCLLNQRVGVLSFKDTFMKDYIYQVLSSNKFENKMIQKGQGAAQKNISNEDVETFLITVSSDENNCRLIAQYLNLLDEKIAIETNLLNDYILEKNYLLNNMFV